MVKTCKNIGMIKRGEEQEGRRNAGEKIGEKKRPHGGGRKHGHRRTGGD